MHELQDMNHLVTSRWLQVRHSADAVIRDETKVRYASEDLADVDRATYFVLFLGDNHGSLVEFGYAVARKKKLIVIGKKEKSPTIFTMLAHEHYESFARWKEIL